MRRAIALAVLAIALTAGAQTAPAGIGIGAFGGVSYPINQDDVSKGPLYGLRAPIKIVPMITVEPYYLTSHLGDGEETIAGVKYTREGFDHTGYGVNAILGMPLGMAFGLHPYAGIGSHKLERAGSPEIKETAYNFGLGMGIGALSKISLQIRGELNMVMIGTTSRKFANATIGLNYSLTP
jgi:opacity protein-like surface antigen